MTSHLDDETLACLAMTEASAAERDAAEAHLATCAECAARLRRDRDLLGLVASVSDVPPPSEQTLRRMRARLMAEVTPRHDVWTGLAVSAAGLAVLATRLEDMRIERILPALACIAFAGIVAAFAARPEHPSSRAATSGVGRWPVWLGLVLVSVVVGGLDLVTLSASVGQAVGCERFIVIAAIVPCVTALYAQHRAASTTQGPPASVSARASSGAIGAAAGALAAQAAMLTWCSSEAGWPHVVVFHVATVLGVSLVGAIAGSLAPAPDLA